MPKLLIVDDEENVRYSLERGLRSEDLEILTVGTGREGIEQVTQFQPDTVLLDVRLPDMSGLEVFAEIQQLDARLPVILMTAYAGSDIAIEAMKQGAYDYFVKPPPLRQLREAVERALAVSRMTRVPAMLSESTDEATPGDRIVGRSPAMHQVYKAVGRVAASDLSVLIVGESGTGKELVARAIYHYSNRNQKPFLAVNCAAIPDTLLESELFGHERGAFTGADRRRIGRFEQATGGTLFLDEIGDLSPASQAKILRVLQDQRFERVGGTELVQTNVRILAATNQNLEELVEAGKYRRDLYHRLKVFTIALPALRDRLDDLEPLVDHFLKRYGPELGKRVRAAAPETLELLRTYPWPGNVRELESALKFALVNMHSEVLTPDCLPPLGGKAAGLAKGAKTIPDNRDKQFLESDAVATAADDGSAPPDHNAAGEGAALEVASWVRTWLREGKTDLYRQLGLAVDRVVLEAVLKHVHGNQVEASRLLGISRTTLRAKLHTLGLGVEKHVLSDSGQAGQDSDKDSEADALTDPEESG